MEKILIMTDSNSGISQDEKKILGCEVLPMPFMINGVEYQDGIDLKEEQFYNFINDDASISTSMPSQYFVEEFFKQHLEDYEYIIFIPTSKSLSNTYSSSKKIAEQFNGRVRVIDNGRISITEREAVVEALGMVKAGKSVDEIEKHLNSFLGLGFIYLSVDKLKYLKKGGRVTPAVALIGDLLKIKPILGTNGEKLDKVDKCRNQHQAVIKLADLVEARCNDELKEYYEKGQVVFSVAISNTDTFAKPLIDEITSRLPKIKYQVTNGLSLSVACHAGPGTFGVGVTVNQYL